MIRIDEEALARAERVLEGVEEGVTKALAPALNRANEAARAEAVRETRETYDIKARDVRATIRLGRATKSNLVASLVSRGPATPLIKFRVNPAQPTRKQPAVLRASVKRSGGKPIPGAFTARAGGRVGVFWRLGQSRLPIEELYGPPVPGMLGEDNVSEAIVERAQEVFDQRFEHEIDRILEGNR